MYARIHARMRARMHVYPEIHDGCVKNFSAAVVRLDMGEVLVVVVLHRLYAARMIHRARARTHAQLKAESTEAPTEAAGGHVINVYAHMP